MALAITRKRGQSVLLDIDGQTIRITVARCGMAKAVLAIDAPQSAVIVREELRTGQDAGGHDDRPAQERCA